MSRVLTIAKREVNSLFFSPIAYLVLFIFMVFMGIIFTWRIFVPGQVVEIRTLIDFSRFALFFVVPMLTMSIFADEYRSGRIEMLKTSPITELDLLLGKFIGAMAFYLLLVASTLVYLIILWTFGRPDLGQVFSSYLGLLFMGCMFVAVGLFYSACTREQIVAALAGIITLGALTIIPFFTPSLPPRVLNIPIRSVLDYLAVSNHIGDFTRGSIELTNVAYFGGFTVLFLFWTYLLLESRKWR
jgi:ABC-2 type transport system permease protein